MPADRLPDTGPHDELLAEIFDHLEDAYSGQSTHPSVSLLVRARDTLEDAAAALRAQTAKTKAESRACDRAEKAFTNVEADLAKVSGELVEALDRLDENEGTIAALRSQLAEARAELTVTRAAMAGDLDEADRGILTRIENRLTAFAERFDGSDYPEALANLVSATSTALAYAVAQGRWAAAEHDRSEARTAAPQPLWVGETSELTTRSKTASLAVYPPRLEVPPRTKIALYAADQTPAAVTREQVRDVIAATDETGTWHLDRWLTLADEVWDLDVEKLTDAVWALLSREGTGDG